MGFSILGSRVRETQFGATTLAHTGLTLQCGGDLLREDCLQELLEGADLRQEL